MTLRSQILYMYVIIHGNSAVQMSFKLTVVHIGHQNKHRTAPLAYCDNSYYAARFVKTGYKVSYIGELCNLE